MTDRNSRESASAHSSFWQTSDFIVGIAILLAIVFNLVWPLGFTWLLARPLQWAVGASLLASGIGLIAAARLAMARAKQGARPGAEITVLLQSGVFGRSRNPVYLGVIMAYSGIGFASGIAWFLVLAVPMIAAINRVLILPEERYLEATFGAEYTAYCGKVRRWL